MPVSFSAFISLSSISIHVCFVFFLTACLFPVYVHRDPRLQQEQSQQQRTSYASNSSAGSNISFRNPRDQILLSQPQLHDPYQNQQYEPHLQPAHGSLPRSQQAPHYKRPGLHLILANPQNVPGPPNQNSPHIYVNLPSRGTQSHNDSLNSSDPPARPPYPSSVRQQLVEEMAQNRAPSTQRDFLTSSQMNMQRMQQPPFFQYPSPKVGSMWTF